MPDDRPQPLSAAFDLEAHQTRLARDGYTVIPDLLSPAALARVREALAGLLGRHAGRNAFEGYATERVYTLVARGAAFEALAEDPRLMALLAANLLPGFLLTASQAIHIRPGQPAQDLHFDDAFYRLPRPRPAVSYSLILAIDPFTEENGATRFIPGSHAWSSEAVTAYFAGAGEDGVIPAVMPAGAGLVYSGTLIHGGGANRSGAGRLAISNQYCQPWARTQENFYLAIPRERVAAMSPRLRQLLGYDIWPPFMGHVTAVHPARSLEPGFRPPLLD